MLDMGFRAGTRPVGELTPCAQCGDPPIDANARRLLPLNHRGHPAESIARRRTGPGSISCTPARADFLVRYPETACQLPSRLSRHPRADGLA